MKNIVLILMFLMTSASAMAGEIVTAENFVRAQSDWQMKSYIDRFDAFGRLHHNRDKYIISKQHNKDAAIDILYSVGVFDLTEPLTLTVPKSDRYQSAMVINQDHSIDVLYQGAHVLTRNDVGTRYVFILIRTFVDPNNASDHKKAQAAQNAVTVVQKDKGRFKVPTWDEESLDHLRNELVSIAKLLPNSKGMFGKRETLNPVIHLLGSAYGWGSLPDADAIYDINAPENNDGKTVQSLMLKDVPADGYWSVTVYNGDGYLVRNKRGVYSLNNKSTKRNADGSVSIQFGGCASVGNCLDIMPNWRYAIRLYQPQSSVLDGRWLFPKIR